MRNKLLLANLLMLMDQVQDAKWRKERLGEEEGKTAVLGEVLTELQPVPVGKARVVKGFRQMWAALSGPRERLEASYSKGEFELMQGLISVPLAARLAEDLFLQSEPKEWLDHSDTLRLFYVAAGRALQSELIPNSIDTSDLVSPIDGKPIRYRFDGTRMHLEAGTGSRALKRSFPPTPNTAT